MTNRTCDADGCDRPHWARGLCSSHYAGWHRKTNGRHPGEIFTKVCTVCDEEWQTRRKAAKFCSDACKGLHYSDTMRTKSPLPNHHPVMVAIRTARAQQKAEREAMKTAAKYAWRTARECPGCACTFTPIYTPNAITCSKRCSRRVHRWRRNAAERNAPGAFTWSEFMQIARRFDYLCAYCGERDGQLEPDHVVPLSRGGSNSTTNLLPSCHACNGEKSARLPHEWAEWRAQRGKPPRITNWAAEDKRYWHLTDVMLAVA